MASNKFIVFAIVASLIVLETVQIFAANDLDVNELLGVWYTIAAFSTSFTDSNANITCFWMTVTKEQGFRQNFKEDIRFVMNEVPQHYDAYGTIVDSEVTLLFPYFTKRSVYFVTILNNGLEQIIREATQIPSYLLLSKLTSVSSRSKIQFETLAGLFGAQPVYFNHTGCHYERPPPTQA